MKLLMSLVCFHNLLLEFPKSEIYNSCRNVYLDLSSSYASATLVYTFLKQGPACSRQQLVQGPLQLASLQGVFYVWAAGLTTAAAVFAGEKIQARRRLHTADESRQRN